VFNFANLLWSLAASREIGKNLTATAGVSNYNIPYTSSTTGFLVDLAYTVHK
jgi:hypothetical protein